MTDIDVRIRIGLRIKQLRAAARLTQDELAYSIDISRSYLAEVETGKRNVSVINLERIARGCSVSLRTFFDDDLFDAQARQR